MAGRKKKVLNPFYPFIVISGVAFGLTALGYFVMATLAQHDPYAAMDEMDKPAGLLAMMNRHGVKMMGWELAVLALASVLAICTDGFWVRRAEAKDADEDTVSRSDETDEEHDE